MPMFKIAGHRLAICILQSVGRGRNGLPEMPGERCPGIAYLIGTGDNFDDY